MPFNANSTHKAPINTAPVVEDKEPFATEEQLNTFKKHLLESKNIVALSGAGLSAASGIPTFRGPGGHWRNYDANTLATAKAFSVNPVLVWQFYAYRRHNALEAKANPGHYALADLATKMKGGVDEAGNPSRNFLHVTQNVDGMLQRAGHPIENLKRLHGDFIVVQCTKESCDFKEENLDDPIVPKLEVTEELMHAIKIESDYRSKGIAAGKKRVMLDPCQPPKTGLSENAKIKVSDLPTCPKCSSLLRPSIVWSGEPLPKDTIEEVDEWFKKAEKVDLCMVIGTTAEVYPAAGYIKVARSMGAKICVINVEDVTEFDEELVASAMDVSKGDWFFQGDSAEILPEILKPVIGDLSWLWRGLDRMGDRRVSGGEKGGVEAEATSITCKAPFFFSFSFLLLSLSCFTPPKKITGRAKPEMSHRIQQKADQESKLTYPQAAAQSKKERRQALKDLKKLEAREARLKRTG